MIIPVYSDPGHGWAKVPRRLLHDLGIAREITPYSYQRKGHVYLEEDYDMGVLVHALRAKGIEFKFKEHVTRERPSRIRGYEQYVPRIMLQDLAHKPFSQWVEQVQRGL